MGGRAPGPIITRSAATHLRRERFANPRSKSVGFETGVPQPPVDFFSDSAPAASLPPPEGLPSFFFFLSFSAGLAASALASPFSGFALASGFSPFSDFLLSGFLPSASVAPPSAATAPSAPATARSEEHTSELQSRGLIS